MSSPPEPRTFEGLVAEEWGAAALTRPDVMALLEPYRETVQTKLDDFDDETQSWRAYCGCIYGWGRGPHDEGAIPNAVQDAVVELLKQPAPTAIVPALPAPIVTGRVTWQTLDRRLAITALRLGVLALCCSPVVENLPVVARLGKWLGLGIGDDAKAVADKVLCEAEALLVDAGEIPKEGT